MNIYKELAAAHANLKLGDPVKQLRDFLTLLESPELTDGDKLRFLGEVVAAISDVSVKADLVRMAKPLDDLEAMRRLFLGENPA